MRYRFCQAHYIAPALILLVCYLFDLPDFARIIGFPLGTFGISTNGVLITKVSDGGPASGKLCVGERVDLSENTIAERYAAISGWARAPGDELHIRLTDGRHIKIVARKTPASDRAVVAVRIAIYVIITAMAAALLMLQPNLTTWAFFLFALAAVTPPRTIVPYFAMQHMGTAGFRIVQAFNGLSMAASLIGGIFFALTLSGQRLRTWRLALFVVGAAAILIAAALRNSAPPSVVTPGKFTASTVALVAFAYAIMCVGFVESYKRMPVKRRLKWILFGAAISFIGASMNAVLWPYWESYGLYAIFVILQVALPATTLYALIKDEVVDLDRAIIHAVVFFVLTWIAIIIVSLLHHGLVILGVNELARVPNGDLADSIEIIFAILTGAGIATLHRRIDDFLAGLKRKTSYSVPTGGAPGALS